jgi:hypothetical protein
MDYISTSDYLLEIERWRYKNIKREEEGLNTVTVTTGTFEP